MSDITNYDRLKAVLAELTVLAPNTPSYMNAIRRAELHAAAMDADAQNQKSYSALIIEACQAKKQCGQCGQLCVAYKEPFRKQWLKCLDVLLEGGAMTYKQIAVALVLRFDYKEAAANNTARMFILSRHWKVIEKAETNSKCPAYQITDYGMRVLHNEESVAAFKWIPARKVDMDTSALPEATYTFARSLEDDNVDDLANKALHVEEAEPITCPF